MCLLLVIVLRLLKSRELSLYILKSHADLDAATAQLLLSNTVKNLH